MARFNAAIMDGAQDERFQNRFNYLLDLLDTAYIVEKRIDGVPIKLEVSPAVGFAFYQGGGADGWVYRGGIELVDGDLSLVTDVLKGPDSDDAYIKLTSYLDVVTWTALDFYADNSGTPIKVSSILNYFNTDTYFTQLLMTPPSGDDGDINIGVENVDGRSSYFWASVEDFYHGSAMGVSLSGTPTEFEVLNDYFGSYYNTTKLVEWSTTYFEYKENAVWHDGNCTSGSNANGYYIKYNDGTMICYGTKDLGTFNVDTADGALFCGDSSVELTWPATFYAAPHLSVSYTGSGLFMYKSGAATTTKGYFTVLSTTSLTGRTEDATYTAIGRWKA